MRTFTHKGYGRIYVQAEGDIEKVEAVIKGIDAFEFDYLPDDFIATFSEYPRTVYTHKFSDLDIDHLTGVCWSQGVPVFPFDAGKSGNIAIKVPHD